MNRARVLFALAMLLPTLGLASPLPAPYTAHYEVLRNGERMGEATMTLKAVANGRLEFSSNTVGSEGLAALTAANIYERSLLRWQEGAPETVSWTFRQKIAWKTRERSLEVDAANRRIEHRDKDQSWSPAYRPGVLDRTGITVAIMNDLASGRTGDLRYFVPDKDQLSPWVFRVGGSERLQTPLGPQRALRVERIRESGNARTTTLWLGQDRNFVPLRILQKEPGGDTIDMRITSLR